MKNLKLQYSSSIQSELLRNAKAFCCNSDSGVVYFADCKNIYSLQKDAKQVECSPLELDTEIPDCDIVQMDYLVESQNLCMTFSSGDLVTYNPAEQKGESVGSVESGILDAAWNSSKEILCILTGHGTFILMTVIFSPFVESDFQPSEYGEKSLVSVGWGSKETQFHGSEGKGAAKIKPISIQPAVSWDDRKPRISWRGDSDYFVTSVIDKEFGCRKLRIWNQEGTLQYTSEVKNGLEQPLCWRPSGNLITCCQQEPNKHKVIFFEKNGLQHGEFDLPYPPNSFAVKEVTWNFDSSILAVWGHELKEKNPLYSITLWTMKNYHWYLKQTLCFDSTTGIKMVLWDDHHPYMLHVLCDNGQFLQYTWTWTYFQSFKQGNVTDNVVMAVIDGDKALITPFRKMIVPPPMCAYYIKCPCAINEVVFRQGANSEDFCLILSDGRIAFFTNSPKCDSSGPAECQLVWNAGGGNGFSKIVHPHYCKYICTIKWECENEISSYPLSLNHWTWIDHLTSCKYLLCVGNSSKINESMLLKIDIPDNFDTSSSHLNGSSICKVESQVIAMPPSCQGMAACFEMACLILRNGKVLQCNDLVEPELNENLLLPTTCVEASLWKVDGKTVIVWMNDKFSLYFNDVLVPTTCTSFSCHDEYLLVTTCDNYLSCYSKSEIAKICFGNDTKGTVPQQSIEQGARIVTSIPKDTKVILQMPRGNLEVIQPRPLVLSSIRRHLDEFQYGKAFDIAKRNRVELNVLHEHDYEAFLTHMETFLEQLSSTTNLNLYLASLNQSKIEETKKHAICQAMRTAIVSSDKEKYFLSYVATFVQENELEEALLAIKSFKGENREKVVDDALKLILFLVDVHELYNVALGTYDFQTAIMVAEKSNMDPKEYMPFLNELEALEENYKKFKVDMHLRNYPKALENISKCSDHFDECLELITEHKLFTKALTVFEPSTSAYKIIQEIYGDYLMDKGYFNEAGLVYSGSEILEKALEAFKRCSNWQLAVPTAHKLGYSSAQISKLCWDLAENLKSGKKYDDAAYLLKHYCKEVRESIQTYIAGENWLSAYELIITSNELDMIETNLKRKLLDNLPYMSQFVVMLETNIIKYTEQLKTARKRKADEKYEKSMLCNNMLLDMQSDASSVVSSERDCHSSVSSSQTKWSALSLRRNKFNQKSSLKKYKLVEGSKTEDLALMMELKELILKLDHRKENFSSYTTIMLVLNMMADAQRLQMKFKAAMDVVEKRMPEIWPPKNKSKQANSYDHLPSVKKGPFTTSNDFADKLKRIVDKKRILDEIIAESCEEIPPPVWRKVDGIFLNCLELPKNFRSNHLHINFD